MEIMVFRKVALASVFLSLVTLSPAEIRTWTSSNGKEIEAELLSFDKGKVHIRRTSDGKEFKMPASRLCQADRDFLKEMKAKAPEEETSTAAIERKPVRPGMKRPAKFPNWEAAWPERVEIDEVPEMKTVEENEEKNRYVYQSTNYTYICDVPLKASVTKEFSKMFEATFKVMQELPLSHDLARTTGDRKRLPILLFGSKQGYYKNGGSPRTAGFFRPSDNTVYIPLDSLGVKKVGSGYQKDFGAENQTLAHELVHQVYDEIYNVPGALGWYSEGLAEYVSCSPYSATGKFTFKGNLRDLAKSVSEYDYDKQTGSNLGKEIKIRDLKFFFLQDYGSFTADARYNYAMGMLITAYFIHMDGEGDRANLTAFLKALRKGVYGEDAIKILLDGRSYTELANDIAKAWRRFGLRLDPGNQPD